MFRPSLHWLLLVALLVAAASPAAAQTKKKEELGPGLWLETVGDQKRILVSAEVCLREVGQIGLECLVCGKGKKEYESIMATEADAKVLHDALKRIGTVPGSPCKYEILEAPAGPAIKVKPRFTQDGKTTVVDADWEAPSDTVLRLTYVHKDKDGQEVEVLPSWDVAAGTELTAILSYIKDAETKEFKPVKFKVPDGKPARLGVQYEQEKGKVVVVPPPYTAATGTPIKITIQYEQKSKLVEVPWNKWVRDGKVKTKNPEGDFVHAGSLTFKSPLDPDGPTRFAAADEGAIICVCDVPTALLALPYWSPKGQEQRFFEPNTEVIPAVGTKVTLILEPVLKK